MNREKLKSITTYLKCMKPFLLSHHPECEKFEKNHTINIGKYRFCIGCFVGYPSALIGIIIIRLLNLVEIFNSFCFLITALVLISTFVLSPLNLTKIKAIKIIQKSLIGLGSAFLFWYILTMQNPFFFNLIYFILVFGLLLTFLNVYHGYSFHKICKKCEYSMDWDNCPGFRKINECFKKHNINFTFNTPEKIE